MRKTFKQWINGSRSAGKLIVATTTKETNVCIVYAAHLVAQDSVA